LAYTTLPLTRKEARRAARWLLTHFGAALHAACAGKPYVARHLIAIAVQETATKWLPWIDTLSPKDVLRHCVFDASGDYPGTRRSAFPQTTHVFRRRYGEALTARLIEAANCGRRLQGWRDKPWIYKGYGLFQYDLQHIATDEGFFRNELWADFGACLERACRVLDEKLAARNGDLWLAIRAYNGSGPAATRYMQNVQVFEGWLRDLVV
jgi:hypothetical protein